MTRFLLVLQLLCLCGLGDNRDPQKHVGPTKKLGEKCTKASECQAAFSSCSNGVCQCNEGFKGQTDFLCKAEAYTCPSGEPLKRNGAVVSCQRALDTVAVTQRSVVRRDAQLSCPTDHFCFLYDKSGAVGSGHCCPVPTNVCPAGKPDKSATCGNLKSSSRTCDLTTHQCLPVKVDGEKVAELCCLRPCAEGLVFWNQKCLEPVAVGDDCEADEQCASGTGVCRKGRCECPAGRVNDTTTNSCVVPSCPPDEYKPEVVQMEKFVQCRNASGCGKDSYCHATQSICCPIPSRYCPQTQTFPSDKDRCRIPTADQKLQKGCDKDFHCRFWYDSAEPAGRFLHGLCCPGADVTTASPVVDSVGDGK